MKIGLVGLSDLNEIEIARLSKKLNVWIISMDNLTISSSSLTLPQQDAYSHNIINSCKISGNLYLIFTFLPSI